MARKKVAGRVQNNGGEWLHTYVYTSTLLLVFFVLLLSMSSLDTYKFNAVVSQFMYASGSSAKIVTDGAASGEHEGFEPRDAETEPEGTLDFRGMSDRIGGYIEQAGLQNAASVSHGAGYVFIRFAE